jgi:WD40 repeat protein
VVRVPKEGPAVTAYIDGRAVAVRAVRDDAKPVLFTLPDGATPVSADLNPDGTRLAVGDDRGRVFVWDPTDRALVNAIDCGHRRPVNRVSLSNDGRVFAAPSADGIGVWAVSEATPLATVPADGQPVFKLFPAGDRLVTSGRSGVVRVWAVAGGREEFALHGHVGRVTGVGVSPDGRTVVSGCTTGEVIVWDRRTGQELIGVRRHSGPVTVIEFAANGKLLVTAGTQLAVWDARKE